MTTLTNEELAEIEKRHADCEAFYAGHGGYRPEWHKDRTILLAKLRARTQAEAQAPTTSASVLTDAVYTWVRDDLSTGAQMRIAFFVQKLIDRLTGANAPATAPKHALRCGYWLDLNCSCKLEGDTP